MSPKILSVSFKDCHTAVLSKRLLITEALAILYWQIKAHHYLSTPAPFSTLLWRVLVMSDNQYYEGYVSVFDSASEVSLDVCHASDSLLTNIKDEWSVQRFQWFTKGFYSVKNKVHNIFISDLRMGA
jgi:inner membrane protein